MSTKMPDGTHYTAKHNDTANCIHCGRKVRLVQAGKLSDGTQTYAWSTTKTPRRQQCEARQEAGLGHQVSYTTLVKATDVGQQCGQPKAIALHKANGDELCPLCKKAQREKRARNRQQARAAA